MAAAFLTYFPYGYSEENEPLVMAYDLRNGISPDSRAYGRVAAVRQRRSWRRPDPHHSRSRNSLVATQC